MMLNILIFAYPNTKLKKSLRCFEPASRRFALETVLEILLGFGSFEAANIYLRIFNTANGGKIILMIS
jgi:hypothetical protein